MSKRAETDSRTKAAARKKGGGSEASRDAAGDAGAASAFYVYCVGERESLAGAFDPAESPEPVESSGPLELIAAGDLAAAASAVPAEEYGEENLAARLSDAAWTATRALRHERVVEHFARRAAVVPLRFGAIYHTRESAARALAEHSARFREALRRLSGREEWGVNLYVERARLRAGVVRASARLRELDEKAEAAPPGQAFLLRKKIEASRETEARAEVKRVAAEVEGKLAAACDGAARLRAVRDERTEHGEVAARFAFLVAREGFGDFRAAAEKLAEEYAPLGFRLELTGPWPAYNFVASGDEEGKRQKAKSKRGDDDAPE
jgi:hypothetical protein